MDEQKNPLDPSHLPGTRKGEEMTKAPGGESGRHEGESTGAGRPAGTRTAKDSTGVNADAERPIVEGSPEMPPP